MHGECTKLRAASCFPLNFALLQFNSRVPVSSPIVLCPASSSYACDVSVADALIYSILSRFWQTTASVASVTYTPRS